MGYNHFYIYMYLDNNYIPFYIGKGIGPRYKIERHFNTKQSYLVRKINKIGINNITIKFLNTNLTEKDAIYWEKYWIKYIGRANKKEGPLCNLTDGGEGSSGHIQSEKTKQLRSQKMKLAVIQNRIFTPAHKKKISDGRKGIFHTKEAKEKMSKNAHKNFGPHTAATKKKISIKNRGVMNGNSKLKENDVHQIKKYHKQNLTNKDISKIYNVSPTTISRIIHNKLWREIQ